MYVHAPRRCWWRSPLQPGWAAGPGTDLPPSRLRSSQIRSVNRRAGVDRQERRVLPRPGGGRTLAFLTGPASVIGIYRSQQGAYAGKTHGRQGTAHAQDPDHCRVSETLRAQGGAMCAGQRRAARVPPTNQERSSFIQSKETWVLLESEVGCLEASSRSRQPNKRATLSDQRVTSRHSSSSA
jgi:hypothetical protein